jgi:hypothetical protein
MDIRNIQSTKGLLLLLLLIFFLVPHQAESQRKKKLKKGELPPPTAVNKENKKEKTLNDFVKSSKAIDGLFTIYQDTITGSLQMLISEDQLNKEFIHFNQIANGVSEAGRYRGYYRGSKVFKITKYFNKIEFTTQNTAFYFDPKTAISKSKEANISQGTMASVKVEFYDKEKRQYLIKADDLFLKETFAQIKPARSPGQKPTDFSLGTLDRNKSKINEIKNYPENTNLTIEYVYSQPSVLNNGTNAVADGRNVSISVYHSLMAMPEGDYEIRLDDPRAGYFITKVDDKTSIDTAPYRDLVERWKLVKKDPEAEISEPVKPITWWLENTTPVEWRETIKEGILEWNKAFEKAGFKNAIVVKQQPDDATWDAGDLRYNVVRFTASPKPIFGGYGPSFVNPRTGEILGADIMMEYSSINALTFYDDLFSTEDKEKTYDTSIQKNDDLFCAFGNLMRENMAFASVALNTFEWSDIELKRIKKEWWKQSAMHEIGHTLGLYHNMKASQLYTPKQLYDSEFMKGKANSGSVMDYTAMNIHPDFSKQGSFYSTTLGPYDHWVIQVGYTPFKSEQDRQNLLSQSTRKEFAFGNDADDMRSAGKGMDPRVMVGDLSNDPISYSIDRFELVNDLMTEIKTKYSQKGKSYQDLRRAFLALHRQSSLAATVVSRYIGGVYIERGFPGQKGAVQPYTPVSLEDQKRAMETLTKYVFGPDAFQVPNELYNYLIQQRRGHDFFSKPEKLRIHSRVLSIQKDILRHLLHPNTLERISDSQLYGNKYTLAAFMSDLNQAIFRADIYGNVNSFRQNLQVEYTNNLTQILTGKSKNSFPNNARSMVLYNLNKIHAMAASSGNTSSRAHKQHLRTLISNALKEIK